jgi:hypothetical protein
MGNLKDGNILHLFLIARQAAYLVFSLSPLEYPSSFVTSYRISVADIRASSQSSCRYAACSLQ